MTRQTLTRNKLCDYIDEEKNDNIASMRKGDGDEER